MKTKMFATLLTLISSVAFGAVEPVEISCSIRESGQSLNCIWLGKDKKTMSPEDVAAYIDQASDFAYITVKSKKGMERTFQPDPNSAQFKKLNDIKKSGSISEISRAKLDLFAEIERKVIRLSDDLDAQAQSADLVKFDGSVMGQKLKKELREQAKELEGLKSNKDKLCTTTPQFEALTRTNQNLQTTLSNILVAFQTSGTCMDSFKVYKDKDGTVDLRQLDGVGKSFVEACRRK